MVYGYCDNKTVVHVLNKEQPRDPGILELLLEYLHIVSIKGFTPIFRKVSPKESRNHDQLAIETYLTSQGLPELS